MKLLVATNNKGKIAELKRLLNVPGLELLTASEAGLPADFDVEETGQTLEENAVLKANQYALAAKMYALADDSGLMVDALDGQPGVYSKRFAGEDATDAERNALILEKLAGLPVEKRGARFVAVVALAGPDGSILETQEGVCPGIITTTPSGNDGFGYDPIFAVASENSIINGRTLAELSADEKDLVSHRGNAVGAIHPIIANLVASNS